MPKLDKPGPWLLPFIFLWIYLIYKRVDKRVFILLLIPVTVLCSDQSGLFIKKMELRARPWVGMGLEKVNHLGGSGGRHKSFPSNHATNSVALAVIFSYLLRRFKYLFWGFAGLIMFSRVYIGVHYPADVFAGGLLGLIISTLILKIFEFISEDKLKRR